MSVNVVIAFTVVNLNDVNTTIFEKYTNGEWQIRTMVRDFASDGERWTFIIQAWHSTLVE